MTAQPLNQIAAEPIRRLSTGLKGIDWLYGSSPTSTGGYCWGMPVGAVSLWAGAAGTGKSRIAVAAASVVSQRKRVLYVQNEVAFPQFRQWTTGQAANLSRFYVSEVTEIEGLLETIQRVEPALVMIDSVSMLEGIERQAKAKEVITGLKRAAEQAHCHIVLIGHLNSRGKVKGGSTLPHLVDTVAVISRGELDGWVRLAIPSKHRYGPTGKSLMFIHEAKGVRQFFMSDEVHPMMQVRFRANGTMMRCMPDRNGDGEVEIDETGAPILPDRRSWLRRLVSR